MNNNSMAVIALLLFFASNLLSYQPSASDNYTGPHSYKEQVETKILYLEGKELVADFLAQNRIKYCKGFRVLSWFYKNIKATFSLNCALCVFYDTQLKEYEQKLEQENFYHTKKQCAKASELLSSMKYEDEPNAGDIKKTIAECLEQSLYR